MTDQVFISSKIEFWQAKTTKILFKFNILLETSPFYKLLTGFFNRTSLYEQFILIQNFLDFIRLVSGITAAV